MSLELSRIKLFEPDYFHRDYQNDLVKKDSKDTGAFNQLLRVGQASLPFIALYKPFGQTMAFLMGGSRSLSCLSKTYCDISEGKSKDEIASDMLQTAIALTSFAGTIFAHPLGMLITTCHDLGNNVFLLRQAWVENDSAKAIEAGLQMLNNSVYLGMFFVGSTEVLVASLALQIITGLYHTSGEFKKGNYLEVGTGVLMATIRMNQMVQPISLLQAKWKLESLNKRAANMEAIASSTTAKSEIPLNSNTPLALVEILIKYGNNPEGIPALHYASLKGDENAVVMLLDHGASPNAFSRQITDLDLPWAHSSSPLTPLDFAASGGHLNVMQTLINRGAQINLTENLNFGTGNFVKWSPAVYFAAKSDQGKAVSFLLSKGALLQPISSIGVSGEFGSALHVAIAKGSVQVLDALFAHGVNIHTQYNQGGSLLHLAVDHDQSVSIDWLIKHKLNVNVQDDFGNTALHRAMSNAKITTVECLLKNGANPNIKNKWNWTPLFSLGEYNPTPFNKIFGKAKLLIEHGADIFIKDDSDRTLFDRLITRIPVFHNKDNDIISDGLETAELLLKKGYDINRKNSQNRTILYYMQQGSSELGKKLAGWLIFHGATV